MKTIFTVLLLSMLSVSFSVHAGDKETAGKIAKKAGKVAAGAAIGGAAGKVIMGSPAGMAGGIIFSPTKIGDGTLSGGGGNSLEKEALKIEN